MNDGEVNKSESRVERPRESHGRGTVRLGGSSPWRRAAVVWANGWIVMAVVVKGRKMSGEVELAGCNVAVQQ